ncbi:hypothetical protein [Propionispira raffinosivorans]|uniref:hypothetical protein n=1 Tax=Propionispira raffinosivorans TaxID=86959 RepID=UPI0003804556|nr:hypothetical protein [Propionispira raffinosivorans]
MIIQGSTVTGDAKDIEGLTPKQIQDKFALPNTPKYVCDVELEKGTHIRVGEQQETTVKK